MKESDSWTWNEVLVSFVQALTFERVVPLVMLLSMSLLLIGAILKAQKRDDFDASMFLRNDRGVLDAARICGLICFMMHTWAYASFVLAETVTENDTIIYAAFWSGTAITFQILEVWRGIKTNTPPLANPTNPMTVEPPPEGTQK